MSKLNVFPAVVTMVAVSMMIVNSEDENLNEKKHNSENQIENQKVSWGAGEAVRLSGSRNPKKIGESYIRCSRCQIFIDTMGMAASMMIVSSDDDVGHDDWNGKTDIGVKVGLRSAKCFEEFFQLGNQGSFIIIMVFIIIIINFIIIKIIIIIIIFITIILCPEEFFLVVN